MGEITITEQFGELLASWTWYEYVAWIGFVIVASKQLTTRNHVTYEASNPVREHKQRILTGLFYVPFVSIACFKVSTVMRLFIILMIYQGMGEYIQIAFLSSLAKSKLQYHNFTWMDRIVQILAIVPPIGFYYSHILASALLYNVFFFIVMFYLIKLILSGDEKTVRKKYEKW